MRRGGARLRRRRPRVSGQLLFIVALLAGTCLGLIVAWGAEPVVTPDQSTMLRSMDADSYAALVALAWAVDGDQERAAARINAVKPAGTGAARHMADMACRLASTDFVTGPGGVEEVRSMMNFYQQEGQRGCADTLLPALEPGVSVPEDSGPPPEPGVTLAPPPGKTPLPRRFLPAGQMVTAEATVATAVRTPTPARPFVLTGLDDFCDATRSATLEVYVQERDGRPIPAMQLRVYWPDGEDRFYTGFKPERGLAYADFVMQEGIRYRIDMPGRAESSDEFATGRCVDEGHSTLRSWRAMFQPAS